jgi:hypothetical protein
MSQNHPELLRLLPCPPLERATLVLALSGWMDGGEVSTGTVNRLVHLLDAQPIAHLDPEPFFLLNFPGSMEIAALFRPHVVIEDGLIKSFEMPANAFFVHRCSSAGSPICTGELSASAFSRSRTRWTFAASCLSDRSAARCRTPASRGCS